MARSVAIVDYGAGNTLNVVRAFISQGIETSLVSDPNELHKYSHIVLPGVGAFNYGMQNLTRLKLGDEIISLVARERPVLGICLGMQLLADRGFENGLTTGLGLIRGSAVHLDELNCLERKTEVPHTGWAPVLWRGTEKGSLQTRITAAYFNHSFFLDKADSRQVIATAGFGECVFPAVVSTGSLLATQFHPEKSGPIGIQMLNEWVRSEPIEG